LFVSKSARLDVAHRCAESGEGLHDPRGVLARRLDPNIEFLRGARMAVDADGVSADHEIPHLSGVEGGEQIEEVLIHAHPDP